MFLSDPSSVERRSAPSCPTLGQTISLRSLLPIPISTPTPLQGALELGGPGPGRLPSHHFPIARLSGLRTYHVRDTHCRPSR